MDLWKHSLALLVIIALVVVSPEQCHAFKCYKCKADTNGDCVGGNPGEEVECEQDFKACAIYIRGGKVGSKDCHDVSQECTRKVLNTGDIPGCATTNVDDVAKKADEFKACTEDITKSLGSEASQTPGNSSSREQRASGSREIEYCTCNSDELCNSGNIKSIGGVGGGDGGKTGKGGGKGGAGNSLSMTGLQMMASLLLALVAATNLFRI